MGQGQDRQDFRHNGGKRPQGQALRRNVATLVGLGLALSPIAVGSIRQQQPIVNRDTLATKQTWQFDQKKAWAQLLKQCEFGPRTPGTDAHKKCRDYLLEEVKKHCDNARLQEFNHLWSKSKRYVTMWNVIGEQNWEKAKVRLVLTAHWDTRPYADQESDSLKASSPILGANDGASGVAVLLEIMRVMKGRLPEDVGVIYLLSDGEDLGPDLDEMLLGTVEFARNLPAKRPDYGILLDMIGDRDLRVPMELQSLQYAPELTRAFYKRAGEAGQSGAFPAVLGEAVEDDHIPLNKAGIPTLDLIDFDFGANNGAWHTLADKPDMCSADSLGKVGIAIEAWLTQTPAYRPKKR